MPAISASEISIAIEQPMKVTQKPTNYQTLRMSRDSLPKNPHLLNQTAPSPIEYYTTIEKVKPLKVTKNNNAPAKKINENNKKFVGANKTSRMNGKTNK